MQQPLNSETNMQAYANIAGRSGNAGIMRQLPQYPARVNVMNQNARAPEVSEHLSTGFVNRLVIVMSILLLASVLLYAAATVFGDEISRGGHSTSEEKLEIVIGNDILNVPENVVRFAKQRKSGHHQRLELYFHWPTLSGYKDLIGKEFNKSSEESNLIFATLEKRSMIYDMSGRISPIYKRFFVGDPTPYKAGLVKQGLANEGGFIDEDLYYAAGSPYPFAARCVKDNSTVGTPYCLRDILVTESLSLTYRFHKRKLEDWISIDRNLRELVKGMIVKPIKN